jgi:hypothetical protein
LLAKKGLQHISAKGTIDGQPYKLDAGHLYRLSLNNTVAGARFHGVADAGIAFKDIAETIGRQLNIPVVSKSAEEAAEHFGWFNSFAGIDGPASGQLTRERLGWHPLQMSLLDDMERGGYFKA